MASGDCHDDSSSFSKAATQQQKKKKKKKMDVKQNRKFCDRTLGTSEKGSNSKRAIYCQEFKYSRKPGVARYAVCFLPVFTGLRPICLLQTIYLCSQACYGCNVSPINYFICIHSRSADMFTTICLVCSQTYCSYSSTNYFYMCT